MQRNQCDARSAKLRRFGRQNSLRANAVVQKSIQTRDWDAR